MGRGVQFRGQSGSRVRGAISRGKFSSGGSQPQVKTHFLESAFQVTEQLFDSCLKAVFRTQGTRMGLDPEEIPPLAIVPTSQLSRPLSWMHHLAVLLWQALGPQTLGGPPSACSFPQPRMPVPLPSLPGTTYTTSGLLHTTSSLKPLNNAQAPPPSVFV
ncbi:hypothetical protein HJG60_008614 [Phyllostomus discolor]|uniref:Uncharacterized protein n=1 Tax=Phyllostomus discolor TaxID=89673 RepID=A0A833Z0G1_9CHIR|nr:hypothetical protein HJG60_008614 [Phyllostomus discolor]